MATETRERYAWNPLEVVAHWFRDQFAEHDDDDVTNRASLTNNDNRSSNQKSGRRREPLENDPFITLYYDEDKQKTIAVLSRPTEALDVYFSCRVAQGTSQQTSILYYEMDGFIRENFTSLRRLHYLGPDSVKLAVGSLEMSDRSHKTFLEDQRIKHFSQRDHSNDFEMLEEVMDIARQHWLEEDLDALSIFFLAQVNKTMNRVARKIVQRRRSELSVSITPYLDGVSLSGYSNFTRSSNHGLVRQMESGRSVEYRQSSSIPMIYNNMDQEYTPSAKSSSTFDWACEEVALGNLHQWGDISRLEYIGQKLLLSCELHPADRDGDQDDCSPTALSCVRLEANPCCGKREWPHGLINLKVEIMNSQMRRLDRVAVSYAGQAKVISASVNFLAIVRTVARRRIRRLRHVIDLVGQGRPLLDHELHYLRMVNELATLL